MDWSQLGQWLLAAIAALAAGFVIRLAIVRKSNKSERTVIQKNNKAGGDIIGGDKINKR